MSKINKLQADALKAPVEKITPKVLAKAPIKKVVAANSASASA